MPLDHFWKEVGEVLLVHRERQGLSTVDIQRRGGPSWKTVQSFEKGHIGNVSNFQKHAKALGLKVADILRSVLAPQALSPEVAQLVRVYEKASLEGRQALTAVARAVEEQARPTGPKTPADREQ